jgi:hypothetical protein
VYHDEEGAEKVADTPRLQILTGPTGLLPDVQKYTILGLLSAVERLGPRNHAAGEIVYN